MRRFLALGSSAALLVAQASSATPALAQAVASGAGRVATVGVTPASPATPAVPLAGPQTSLSLSPAPLLPSLSRPIALSPRAGGATAITVLARNIPHTLLLSPAARGRGEEARARGVAAAAKPEASAARTASARLETAREGLRPGARTPDSGDDTPAFLHRFWTGSRRFADADGGEPVAGTEAGPAGNVRSSLAPPSSAGVSEGDRRASVPLPAVGKTGAFAGALAGAAWGAGLAGRSPAVPALAGATWGAGLAGRNPAVPALAGATWGAGLPWLQAASPYALAAGVLAATWGAAKLVRRGVDYLARKASEGVRKAAGQAAALATWAAGLAAAAHVAGIRYPQVVEALQKADAIPWVHAALPYALAGVALLLTKPVARLARRLADRLADRGRWAPGTRLLARHAAGWAAWLIGALVASQAAGIDPATLAKSLGITTLAMSLALKGFLGNLIQGAALLLGHPFDIGDRVRVGKVDYRVVTMTLREVQLTKDDGGTIQHFTYSELAGLPITIFKPYVSGRAFVKFAKPDLKAYGTLGSGGFWLRAAGAAALGLGALVPGALFLHPWLLQALPWAYALGAAVATFFAARLIGRFVEGFARKRGWAPNETMLARMAASALTLLTGLGAALRILGVSWAALGASAGVTGIVITIAATALIESTIQALTLLAGRPFTLGDRIKVGDDEGVVVDVTLRYVVIKKDEPGEVYTLLPVALFTKFEGPGSTGKR